MDNVFVYPYRPGSASAAGLANALGVRRISHTNSRFRGTDRKTVINWGATTLPPAVQAAGRILNPPELVRNASNKRIFFERVAATEAALAPRVPDWTLNAQEAAQWLRAGDCRMVLARTVLAGHSGEGIVIYDSAEALAEQPNGVLYVKYIPKREEFRAHVDRNGEIFVVQRKARRFDAADPNYTVRNHQNGFIYARENVALPNQDAEEQVRKAIQVTGLDFGAVDIIYNERRGLCYVLEINTAPGLEGSTVLDYARQLRGLLGV